MIMRREAEGEAHEQFTHRFEVLWRKAIGNAHQLLTLGHEGGRRHRERCAKTAIRKLLSLIRRATNNDFLALARFLSDLEGTPFDHELHGLGELRAQLRGEEEQPGESVKVTDFMRELETAAQGAYNYFFGSTPVTQDRNAIARTLMEVFAQMELRGLRALALLSAPPERRRFVNKRMMTFLFFRLAIKHGFF